MNYRFALVGTMTGVNGVAERLEHIEKATRDTAEAMVAIRESVATLLERSAASAAAFAEIRAEVKALRDDRNYDAQQLAQLPGLRRDIDGLGDRQRTHDTRIAVLEREQTANGVRNAGIAEIFNRVLNVVQALILGGIMWLFTLKGGA